MVLLENLLPTQAIPFILLFEGTNPIMIRNFEQVVTRKKQSCTMNG